MQAVGIPSRACTLHSHGGRGVRCQHLVTSAKLSFPKLPNLFQASGSRNSAKAAQAELLELVVQDKPDLGRVGELVDVLADSGLPFKESSIGGGPWVVVYTRGPLLWQATTSLGKLFNPNNEASQDFDPATRTVVNRGELLGKSLYVTAEGTYEPLGNTSTMPVDLEASIERGSLHVLGKQLPLPIRGKGEVSIAYLNGGCRVFRQRSGTLAVQIRADLLKRQLASKTSPSK